MSLFLVVYRDEVLGTFLTWDAALDYRGRNSRFAGIVEVKVTEVG